MEENRKQNDKETQVLDNIDNPDVMEKIIYTVGGVVIGAFGGYGFGKNKCDE